MPVTRDRPSRQGGCPWPRPRQGSPNKAIVQAGLACRGQPVGVCSASQGPPGGAPLPPRAGSSLAHVGHTPWEPTGRQRSPAVGRSTGRWCQPGKPNWVKNPDKDEVSSPVCDRPCCARPNRSFVARDRAAGRGPLGPGSTGRRRQRCWPTAPPCGRWIGLFRADCCRFAARAWGFAGGRRRRGPLTWGGAEGI
jgi:hypothetical protein